MRGWLYSFDEPEGKIFDGKEYAAKVKDGWVDTPALLENEPAKKPGRPRKVQP